MHTLILFLVNISLFTYLLIHLQILLCSLNSKSMMKTEKELLPYVIPSVEIIEVEVEKGFAGTNMEDFVEGEETEW